ncbi:MAG: RNA pseudouridine synthase [Bacteroidetes bacterium GWF2_38_335]|nr:MAG: RNA pseudouridine synthase [Bacteroidetes bacterium GWF2_38_335]OFY81112.1 MAG: RNA pseudouridine synthase [Bacteroidetes bacterium RIFOXYA12_FULL_38_20]HBS86627.1 RNA pseudouridine synthase [Bacteroidales bacterium]
MCADPEELELEEQPELFEHFRFEVDKGQSLLRIDKFLVNRIENVSRSKIQDAADAGNILVNSNPVKSNYKVKPGDIVSIVMTHPPREIELIPQDIPIKIIYEDDDVILVNKDPEMVVHPAYGNYSGTLVNALAWHLKELPLFSSGEARPGLVHRIDKNTSGILVVAKNEKALNKLAKQFFDRTTDRKYIAIVWGSFDEKEGTITGNIGRSLKDRKKMDVFPEGNFGKHAVTHYKVLEELGYLSVVECKLETGRTHQIRVHFAHIGHPIFNDDTYGGDQILKGTTYTKYKQFVQNCFKILPRHALHAKSLAFDHPVTKKRMMFDSELPEDMVKLIEKWKVYLSGRTNEE